jgi:DNA-binding IclR family transcriptional regulator
MPINPSPAVVRAGELLGHLARHPTTSFSVSELARELDVPRATCDSILQGLAEGGLVTRRPDDLRYELGPSCVALGDAARLANSVLRASAAAAQELARSLGACAAVSMRDGEESRVAEVFDHGPPFGPSARVGQSMRHAPPFGAVYVAWDPDDAEAWISRAGASLSRAQRERYRRALAEVRTRGYSVTIASPRQPELLTTLETLAASPDADAARRTRDALIAEFRHSEYLATDLDAREHVHVSHMSAPVFDQTGRAVASILVVGPDYDITTAELRARGDRVLRAAERATEAAGGRAPRDRAIA